MSAFLEVRARANAAGIGDDVVIAFQKFDTDASGDIDVEELRYALEAAGLSVDDEQSAFMMRKYDDDRGTSLDIEEFAALVKDLRSSQFQSIQQRISLRTSKHVLHALNVWWDIVLRALADFSWPTPEAGKRREGYRRKGRRGALLAADILHHQEYVCVMKKVMRAMTEGMTEEEANEIVEAEWENDRKGMDYLDRELFKDGLFELADVWSRDVDGDAYGEFLLRLAGQVAQAPKPGEPLEFRDDWDIQYAGYDEASIVERPPLAAGSSAEKGRRFATDDLYGDDEEEESEEEEEPEEPEMELFEEEEEVVEIVEEEVVEEAMLDESPGTQRLRESDLLAQVRCNPPSPAPIIPDLHSRSVSRRSSASSVRSVTVSLGGVSPSYQRVPPGSKASSQWGDESDAGSAFGEYRREARRKAAELAKQEEIARFKRASREREAMNLSRRNSTEGGSAAAFAAQRAAEAAAEKERTRRLKEEAEIAERAEAARRAFEREQAERIRALELKAKADRMATESFFEHGSDAWSDTQSMFSRRSNEDRDLPAWGAVGIAQVDDRAVAYDTQRKEYTSPTNRRAGGGMKAGSSRLLKKEGVSGEWGEYDSERHGLEYDAERAWRPAMQGREEKKAVDLSGHEIDYGAGRDGAYAYLHNDVRNRDGAAAGSAWGGGRHGSRRGSMASIFSDVEPILEGDENDEESKQYLAGPWGKNTYIHNDVWTDSVPYGPTREVLLRDMSPVAPKRFRFKPWYHDTKSHQLSQKYAKEHVPMSCADDGRTPPFIRPEWRARRQRDDDDDETEEEDSVSPARRRRPNPGRTSPTSFEFPEDDEVPEEPYPIDQTPRPPPPFLPHPIVPPPTANNANLTPFGQSKSAPKRLGGGDNSNWSSAASGPQSARAAQPHHCFTHSKASPRWLTGNGGVALLQPSPPPPSDAKGKGIPWSARVEGLRKGARLWTRAEPFNASPPNPTSPTYVELSPPLNVASPPKLSPQLLPPLTQQAVPLSLIPPLVPSPPKLSPPYAVTEGLIAPYAAAPAVPVPVPEADSNMWAPMMRLQKIYRGPRSTIREANHSPAPVPASPRAPASPRVTRIE